MTRAYGWAFAGFVTVLVAGLVLSIARGLYSTERAAFDAKIVAYHEAQDNAVREQPLPGEITALLSDGRTVRLTLNTADNVKPGSQVRISERVAPWGETWYWVID